MLRLLRALRAIAHWKVLAELVGGLLSSTMTMARASLRGEGFKLLRVAMFFFAVQVLHDPQSRAYAQCWSINWSAPLTNMKNTHEAFIIR